MLFAVKTFFLAKPGRKRIHCNAESVFTYNVTIIVISYCFSAIAAFLFKKPSFPGRKFTCPFSFFNGLVYQSFSFLFVKIHSVFRPIQAMNSRHRNFHYFYLLSLIFSLLVLIFTSIPNCLAYSEFFFCFSKSLNANTRCFAVIVLPPAFLYL